VSQAIDAAPASSLDEILALYERWGTEHYDEELSQLDHALQTAALAVAANATDPLVAAALLHDVGHLLDLAQHGGAGDERDVDLGHESSGSKYLAALFPPAVTAPIALHVRAKRYRCAVDPAYHAGLSSGSQRSLEMQGGPMTAHESTSFEQNPGFEASVQLRAWDDLGKVDGLDVAPLRWYRPLLERVLIATS